MKRASDGPGGRYFEVAEGVWGMKEYFVNLYMVRNKADRKWILVDTGLPTSAANVKQMARDLFGPGSRPEAIVLTHGHFDHAGSVKDLASDWDVSVYAHEIEHPYLTDRSSYPPADPTVGGGLVSRLSPLFPLTPIDISLRLRPLPSDGNLPGVDGWRWLHTPGHAPGHVSLWRVDDRTRLVGDAFVTQKSESALATLLQPKHVHGPPSYVTYDWTAARHSVRELADLEPRVVASGHGQPMRGHRMQEELADLADHFTERAVPKRGRYRDRPAVADKNGVAFVPPKPKNETTVPLVVTLLAGFATGLLLASLQKRMAS